MEDDGEWAARLSRAVIIPSCLYPLSQGPAVLCWPTYRLSQVDWLWLHPQLPLLGWPRTAMLGDMAVCLWGGKASSRLCPECKKYLTQGLYPPPKYLSCNLSSVIQFRGVQGEKMIKSHLLPSPPPRIPPTHAPAPEPIVARRNFSLWAASFPHLSLGWYSYVFSQGLNVKLGFPGDSVGKESACNAREMGLILTPLEEEMATHSSILAWRLPKDRGTCRDYSGEGCKQSDMTEATEYIHVQI